MAAAVEVAERAASDAKDQSTKSERERRSAEEHAAESAAALARERADRKADAASFAAERKDLQVCPITLPAFRLRTSGSVFVTARRSDDAGAHCSA